MTETLLVVLLLAIVYQAIKASAHIGFYALTMKLLRQKGDAEFCRHIYDQREHYGATKHSYLINHESPEWQSKSPTEKIMQVMKNVGMTPTRDLAVWLMVDGALLIFIGIV